MDTESKQIVMVVDDSLLICKQIQIALEGMPIFLFMAHTGEEAMEMMQQYQPDLILLDVILPDIDGYQLFRELKGADKNNVSIIFLTSKDKDDDVVKGFSMGACDYIKKPFVEGELQSRVMAHLQIKRQRDELLQQNIELRSNMERLNYMAFRDGLTGLYNRRYVIGDLVNDIKNSSQEDRNHVVALADIDDFKRVNDTYGHEAGDMALKSVADIMESHCRNHKVVRWGGEEFLIILFNVTEAEAFEICEAIRKEAGRCNLLFKGNGFNCTLTFGLHMYKAEEGLEECIRCADKALYYGKRHGKDCSIWFEKI